MAFTALSALEAFLAPLAQEEEDEESMLLGLSWLDYRVGDAVDGKRWCQIP